LQAALDRGALTIQQNADGVDAEYTLVLEAVGDPPGFLASIRRLQTEYKNVDLLFETQKEDIDPDDDFYIVGKNEERDNTKSVTFKYFCVFANQQALGEILSLWKHYCDNEQYVFPFGKAGLKNIFKNLKDIHLWGVKERFEETGTKEQWEQDLLDDSLPDLKCEIEFKYYSADEKRWASQEKVTSAIIQIGGSILTESNIPEIAYHAILASIPRQAARQILQQPDVSFVNLNEILFIRPSGQTAVTTTQDSFDYTNDLDFPQAINNEPIIALFDGLPQENHPILSRFLTIDDPEGYTASYQVKDRQHGTAMASLIAWGDLSDKAPSITHKIYARPIMKPEPTLANGETIEFVPENVLLVDQIHIAVRRLFEPTAGRAAPSVRVINLSIGIKSRPFDNFISPLAKLLDWLSFQYHVLFIVSAGNYGDDIDLGLPFTDFAQLNYNDKDRIIIESINKKARYQRIISPAESMNALTIGALFADSSDYPANNPGQLLPCSPNMPSPISALGRGINHSIKPDLLINGGRSLLSQNMMQQNLAHWRTGTCTYPPGILSAKPVDPTGGKGVGYTFGTSDAAAILSHNAMLCYDVLDEVFTGEGTAIPPEYAALLLKAMLVHGCKWDDVAPNVYQALSMTSRKEYADKIHKWIGYGVPDIERVKECAKNRVTLIGFDELKKDSAHIYSVPLPFAFHSNRIVRNLTVTLASFTPINLAQKKYRKSQVWFTIEKGKEVIGDRCDISDKAAVRGTLQHERFSCNQVSTWSQNDALEIKVNCREDADGLTDSIPYAIFVTFEMQSQNDIDVYALVRDRIAVRQAVGVRV
jgi:hypothetical protein